MESEAIPTLDLAKALEVCQKYTDDHSYGWFRITYSHVGNSNRWVVWYEDLQGSRFTSSRPTLLSAIAGFLLHMQCAEETLMQHAEKHEGEQ